MARVYTQQQCQYSTVHTHHGPYFAIWWVPPAGGHPSFSYMEKERTQPTPKAAIPPTNNSNIEHNECAQRAVCYYCYCAPPTIHQPNHQPPTNQPHYPHTHPHPHTHTTINPTNPTQPNQPSRSSSSQHTPCIVDIHTHIHPRTHAHTHTPTHAPNHPRTTTTTPPPIHLSLPVIVSPHAPAH
jgi:hypothetical protein